ncbi:putative U3 small nucleolar ribonucleoprotein IMP4 [Giardia muris]|uniref:Putative U3 small nucleolar ribonucleoprotein IMP4 n=1 Tax=Giardia muris TaxID=5742 RepID=A0A4Z1SUE2_GIAMU|nr:putative U3 small nucleolar ribonucleoprotein IMP4 [Giardia muris]|eukprot:TNJ27228.1 putative U3 small nucleolar ribonucleoprotein IMP4 [Giardia muris]
MQRRNARLRQEYLLGKQLRLKEQEERRRRRLVAEGLEEGRILADDVRNDAIRLAEDLRFEDAVTKEKEVDDDEYTQARPPKLLLTTSRDPSTRLKAFAKELRILFPTAQRVNRGSHTIGELVSVARESGFTDLLLVHETRGNPDGLIVSHLPYGPTAHFTLSDVVLRSEVKEIGTALEQAPHLIFEGFQSPLGHRFRKVLQHLFPTARKESRRVCTFVNRQGYLLFRQHAFQKVGDEVVLKELGPRFVLMPHLLRLDTIDSKVGDVEWQLSSFTNTARFKTHL